MCDFTHCSVVYLKKWQVNIRKDKNDDKWSNDDQVSTNTTIDIIAGAIQACACGIHVTHRTGHSAGSPLCADWCGVCV